MQLRNNDSLGTVDQEGPVLGHDRNLSEVDLLLLHVTNGLRALGVLPGHQSNRHLEGTRVSHPPLKTFLNVVFRLFQGVPNELQGCRIVEIANREYGCKNALQPHHLPLLHFHTRLEKLVERRPLQFKQIRNVNYFLDLRI